MTHRFGQIGMPTDFGRGFLILVGLGFAAVGLAVWLFLFVGSGGRGPRVPRLGLLPRAVGPALAVAAAVLWAATGWPGDPDRSRAVLPYAAAATVAAVCALWPAARRGKA